MSKISIPGSNLDITNLVFSSHHSEKGISPNLGNSDFATITLPSSILANTLNKPYKEGYTLFIEELDEVFTDQREIFTFFLGKTIGLNLSQISDISGYSIHGGDEIITFKEMNPTIGTIQSDIITNLEGAFCFEVPSEYQQFLQQILTQHYAI